MVYENDDGTLMIYDWKRSKGISTINNFNKSGLIAYFGIVMGFGVEINFGLKENPNLKESVKINVNN